MDTLGPEIFKNPHPDKTWKARCTRWGLRLGGAAILIAVGVAGSTWLDFDRPAGELTVDELITAMQENDSNKIDKALATSGLRVVELQEALAAYAVDHSGEVNGLIARQILLSLQESAEGLLEGIPLVLPADEQKK